MNEVTDKARDAHAELDALLADAKAKRTTGSVVVEVHLNAGVPGAIKVRTERTIK